jgi:hypothetical protein
MQYLRLAIRILSLVGLISGTLAGAYLWREGQPLPPGSILAWVWFFGGFIAFVGGILQIKQSRSLALICAFGGFVVFLTAALYLNEAARIYDQDHGYWRGGFYIK